MTIAYVIISKSVICLWKALEMDHNMKCLNTKFEIRSKVETQKIKLFGDTCFTVFRVIQCRLLIELFKMDL